MDGLGARLFGRALRLRVLVWVRLRDGTFFQSEAARGVAYSSASAVAKELDMLESLGMVRKFGRPSGAGRQNYLRVDSPLWLVVDAALGALDSDAGEASTA